jgi:hypothetical protein
MSEPIRKEQIAEEGLFDNVIKPMLVAREEFDKLNVVIKSTAENLGKLNASESAKNVRELADAEAKLNEVYETKKTIQRANIDNENEIVRRRRELSELSKTHQRDIEAENRLINDKNGSISANAKALAEMQAQNKTLTATLKTLAKQYETNQISLEQYSSKSGVLIQEQTKLKVAMGEAQIAMKAQIKEQNAAEGSIDALTHRLGQLRDAQRKMTPEFRENSEAGKFLQITIKQLEEQVNSLNQRSGNFHGSVGNYVEALDTLKQKFESGTMGIREMSREIREFQAIAMRARAEGNTVVEKQALQLAAQYTDQIGDLQRETQMLASDTRTLDAAMTFGKGIAGASAMYQGFRALGLEGAKFEETMQKMVAVNSILNGVKQVEAVLNKSNWVLIKNLNIVTKAQSAALIFQTKAQNVLTAAKVRGAVAAKALNAAMLGFIGLGIAAFVFTIVKAFQYFNKTADETVKKQKILKDTQAEVAKGMADLNAKVAEMRTNFDLAKEGIISKEKALESYNKEFGDTLGYADDLNEAEELFVAKTDAYIKATMLRQQAQILMQKAAEEQVNFLLATEQDQRSAVEKTFNSISKGLAQVFNYSTAGLVNLNEFADKAAEVTQKVAISRTQQSAAENSRIFSELAADMLKQAALIDAEFSLGEKKKNERIRKERHKTVKQEKDFQSLLMNQRLAELDNFVKAMEGFNQRQTLNVKTEFEKQRFLVTQQYAELIRMAKKYNVDTKALEEARNKEIEDINQEELKSKLKTELESEIEKLEALNKQRELDNIKKAKTQDEFNELEKQRKIDHLEGLLAIEQKYGEKTIDTEIAIASARQDLKEKDEKNSEQLAKSIEQIYTKSADNAIQALQRQSDAAGNMFSAFSQMAEHGTIEMSQSMAAMIDRQEQIQRQQEKIEQRKLRMQRASSVGTILTKALDSGKSVPEALAEVGAFLAASEALMPSFYEGTENTGKGGNLDANGGFIAKLHKGERVITENQNRLIGDVSNPVVADVVYKWRTGQLENNGGNSVQLMHTLTNEMREIKKAIQNQPQQIIGLEETLTGVVKLATATRKGSHTKTSRYHD